MKRVFIVRDCVYYSSVSEIGKLAEESYKQKAKRYYNIKKSGKDQECVENSKIKEGERGIIMILSYIYSEQRIDRVYIGSAVFNAQRNLEYTMYRCIKSEDASRAIEGIVDKIDLNIDTDFEEGAFLKISTMKSLYDELEERIHSIQWDALKETADASSLTNVTEEYTLCSLAQKDRQSRRIYHEKPVRAGRTEFQRDRERVVNCKSFRRLVDKAQIFGAEKGDYYRTRMTHTLEVNQIAKAIAFALNLNLDLTEAIALGHDLGHTPFGHQGERTLDDILCGKIDGGLAVSNEMLKNRCFGGFKHNYQSAKILTQLEEKYADFPGLNVSVQVVDGVLKHTRLKKEIALGDFLTQTYLGTIQGIDEDGFSCAATMEGQVVFIADEIAQRGHDVDDALTSGVMTIDEFIDRLSIDKCSELQRRIQREQEKIEQSARLFADKYELAIARIVSRIVNYFIEDVIRHTAGVFQEHADITEVLMDNRQQMVDFSPGAKMLNEYLEKIVQKKVICNSEVARADYNAKMIITTLFRKYYENPRLLHKGTVHKIFIETLKHEEELVSNSAVDLNDGSISLVNAEIEEITRKVIEKYPAENLDQISSWEDPKDYIVYVKRKILVRNIVDFIAGMTDGYALEEFARLK
ncbi:MAG: dNTP triphosphohydrolase [Lachnospiraceae bacterium]|nr:dNTP triphosphohydrolase [Lachnospiraceae bacterium]